MRTTDPGMMATDSRVLAVRGSARTIEPRRQAFAAHLVDEHHVGIVPAFLGTGLRMFERMDELDLKADLERAIESPGRVDLYYRILK